MEIISHRINTLNQLKNLDCRYGAEIDVRYHNNDLVLHHDPFGHGDGHILFLNDFLENWSRDKILILNLKSEGIESLCIELMNQFEIKNWFFLDMSMPYFVKYSSIALKNSLSGFSADNLAVRYSDFEPIEYAISFRNKVKWLWVDTFQNFPLDSHSYEKFVDAGFKFCLVSPELQGGSKDKIIHLKSLIQDFSIHAVCTKFPEVWE